MKYKSSVEIGKLVNSKQVSPVEVMQECLDDIERINPELNAFTYTKPEEALEEAKKLEAKILAGEDAGPFAGVPVGLKDFLPSKKGWTASHGGVPCMITVDEEDGAFYSAVKKLGAIAVGKTNAPAFGFRATCDNVMYGPTKNPFDYSRNSGGSSGGSASAVGAGLLTLAEGGDAGGSIRVPAAWCSCVGFKPSAGLVPSICRPDAWTATHPYCCGGPICNTVEDAAITINAMKRYDPKDPISVHFENIDFLKEMLKGVAGLRVGVTYNFNLFPNPDPEIASVVDKATQILRDAGAIVEFVDFDFNKSKRKTYEDAWLLGISIDSAVDFELQKLDGIDLLEEHTEDFPAVFRYWADKAINANMLDYRNFHEIRTEILDTHLKVFENCDVVIAPVTGCLPVLNGSDNNTHGVSIIGGESVDPLIGFAYTYLENMIGFPAASIPTGFSSTHLPIGLQVIAPRYRDDLVFRIMETIERDRGF